MRVNELDKQIPVNIENPAEKPVKPSGSQAVFDKYVVNNAEELRQLNDNGLLRGAFIITGDRKHVGIHKIFWVAQKIRQFIEKVRGIFLPKREIDTHLCHGMIAVGWDNSWSDKKNAYNNRPLLAHSVLDGVKLNAVDYFNYADKDVDHMVVYIPKDDTLREEFAKNAEQSSKISSEIENRSKFSWGHLLTCLFKKQVNNHPSVQAQKNLSYTLADLLLKRKLSPENEKDNRPFYCMEYAMEMLQASILTKELSEEDRKQLMHDGDKALTREEIAKKIYARLKDKNNKTDPLAKAYWESRICTQISSNGVLSSYAAHVFNKISENKQVPVGSSKPKVELFKYKGINKPLAFPYPLSPVNKLPVQTLFHQKSHSAVAA